ncbi:MAG: LysR family transcriptional regulator [Bdellovibrionota bacterium]
MANVGDYEKKYRLNDLKIFVETSQCSTFSQAANKLEISQPAVSESIKRLEEDLSTTLFYRSRNGIQLTSSGKIILDKAHAALQSLDELYLSKDGMFSGRTISVGCHSTVAQYFIPTALSYLKKQAPDYKIQLVHDLSRNIQSQIQFGNIDIGIIINPVEVPDLIITKLATDEVSVWTSKSGTDFNTIICNQHLFQSQSILKKWKNKPSKILGTDNLDLICRLVHEEIGYGIIPERAVSLSKFPLKKMSSLPSYKDDICLVYRPEFGKIPSEKLVVEALKKAIT